MGKVQANRAIDRDARKRCALPGARHRGRWAAQQMRLKFFAVFLGFLLTMGIAHADEPVDVSIIQLISTPERYERKVVRLIAFLRIEFEGHALYMHREDYEQGITRNGIWIELPSQSVARSKPLDQSYIIAVGTFDSTNKGHMGLWSGSLSHVSRLDKWPAAK